MKKLLVVLLALTFVVAISIATFAVTTASVDGKVELTLTAANQISGAVDGKIVFDLMKDYGDGYKAGLKIKITPNGADAPNQFDEVTYDGAGWIEITRDWAVITLKTDLNGNAAKDLGGQCDLTSGPGLQVVTKSLMEGLTLTAVVNDQANLYNYMLKGEYAGEALTVGAGYQSNTVVDGSPKAANDSMAAWVGYKISDSMNASFEYTSRPNVDADGATAMLLKFGYSADPLTVNAEYFSKTAGYKSADLDTAIISIPNIIKSNAALVGGYLSVGATYKLSDAISFKAGLDYSMIEGATQQLMCIMVGVKDQFTDALSAELTVTMLDPVTQIIATLTDKLADGLSASLEVKNTSAVGASVTEYTAKITATL